VRPQDKNPHGTKDENYNRISNITYSKIDTIISNVIIKQLHIFCYDTKAFLFKVM